MKTRILILLTLTLMMQPLMAQVTGNVKMINIYGDTLSDNSGIKVVFQPLLGGAVADSTATNSNGDFSINLAAGTYDAIIIYDTMHTQLSKSSILAPNYTLGNLILFEYLPKVILPEGNISGSLPGFIHYEFAPTSQTTYTIPAGDTLVINEGSIANFDEGYDTILKVYGHLQIQGSDTSSTLFGTIDRTDRGYVASYNSSAPTYIGGGTICVFAGGSVTIDNASPVYGKLKTINSSVDLNKIINPDLRSMYEVPWSANEYNGALLTVYSEQSTINITESNLSGVFYLEYNNTINLSCSFFESNSFNVGPNNNLYSKFCTYTFESGINCNDCDSIVLSDNTINELWFNTDINTGLPPSQVSLTNNTITSIAIDAKGPQNFTMNNNAIFDNEFGTFDSHVTFSSFDHNLLTHGLSVNKPNVTGAGSPNWVIPFKTNIDYYTLIDTVDSHFNEYLNGSSTYFDYDSVFKYSTSSYCGFEFQPFADTLFIDTGDPSILDPDGSRSDRGSRDIYGCNNEYLFYYTGSQNAPTVADSVYPGDTNHDGIANNDDLLPIGLKYLQTGPVRPSATTNWVGQDAPDWNDNLASNLNIKHVDCNGDGIISSPDVNAIYLNYGLTHNNPKQRFAEGLWYQLPTDSIFAGDTIEVGIMLGRSLAPVNNFYGMAFTMLYDSAFIKPGTAKMTFDPCWVGTDSVNMISLFREDTTVLKYDAALVRTDGQNVSGFGQIGTLSVVMNDDIQAKDEMVALTYMDFEDILAINFQEQDLQIGGQMATFNTYIGFDRTVSIKSIDAEMLQLFPNPAKDKLRLKNNLGTLVSYQLFNLNGSLLLSGSTQNMEHSIDISALDNGLYIVKLQTANAEQVNKVSILR